MQYIEAPSIEAPIYPIRLFLAGGISNCPQWQAQAVDLMKDLPITIYNPRRKDFDISDPSQTIDQIKWEYERLRSSTTLIFWFCKETVCPITLFEYGSALERTDYQGIFLGADPDYSRITDLEWQTKLRLGKCDLHHNIFNLVNAFMLAPMEVKIPGWSPGHD
jgi:hypothetical protein